MFGVVAFGGRQYTVEPGFACNFEKIDGDEGNEVQFDNLVLLSGEEGVVLEKDRLERYNVKGVIVKQFRENKVIVFKKKRRKDYTRKKGHRQYKTLVLIKSIELKN